jgi:hypothetical protein
MLKRSWQIGQYGVAVDGVELVLMDYVSKNIVSEFCTVILCRDRLGFVNLDYKY